MRRGFKTRTHGKSVTAKTNYAKGLAVLLGIFILLSLGFVAWKKLSPRFFGGGTTTPTPTGNVSPTAKKTSSTPTIPATATPTPTPTLDLSLYSVQVLNGNGVAGATVSVSEKLIKRGFKIASTGNASRWDYGKTEIRAKSHVPAQVLEIIDNEISSLYKTEKQPSSDQTGQYDILIVLGKDTP